MHILNLEQCLAFNRYPVLETLSWSCGVKCFFAKVQKQDLQVRILLVHTLSGCHICLSTFLLGQTEVIHKFGRQLYVQLNKKPYFQPQRLEIDFHYNAPL